MKLQSLTPVLTVGAIALGITTLGEPSQAQNTTFFCDTSNGVPTTIAQTPRGKVPVIRWVSSHFSSSGYNPQRRCEEVSGRFQTYYSQGTLNFVTKGRMNGQNVVCVASTNGGPCNGLLFTLKPGENSSTVVQRLFDVRSGASGPLNESTERYYLDMNNYLNTAPVEGGSSANTAPPAQGANPAVQPSSPTGTSNW